MDMYNINRGYLMALKDVKRVATCFTFFLEITLNEITTLVKHDNLTKFAARQNFLAFTLQIRSFVDSL